MEHSTSTAQRGNYCPIETGYIPNFRRQSSVPIPEHTHSTWEGLYVKGKLRGSLMPAIVPKADPLPK